MVRFNSYKKIPLFWKFQIYTLTLTASIKFFLYFENSLTFSTILAESHCSYQLSMAARSYTISTKMFALVWILLFRFSCSTHFLHVRNALSGSAWGPLDMEVVYLRQVSFISEHVQKAPSYIYKTFETNWHTFLWRSRAY